MTVGAVTGLADSRRSVYRAEAAVDEAGLVYAFDERRV